MTTDRALTGVTATFTLADGSSGAPRGAAGTYYQSIVRVPPDHSLLDFSTQGTTPFDGTIAPGTTRLMYAAGIDDSASAAAPFGPLRFDVVLHANEGTFTASCATAEMLPSS